MVLWLVGRVWESVCVNVDIKTAPYGWHVRGRMFSQTQLVSVHNYDHSLCTQFARLCSWRHLRLIRSHWCWPWKCYVCVHVCAHAFRGVCVCVCVQLEWRDGMCLLWSMCRRLFVRNGIVFVVCCWLMTLNCRLTAGILFVFALLCDNACDWYPKCIRVVRYWRRANISFRRLIVRFGPLFLSMPIVLLYVIT